MRRNKEFIAETAWLRAGDGVQLLVEESSDMSWVFAGCITKVTPIRHI